LKYLERHLRSAGFRVGLITGKTPDDLDEDRLVKSSEPTRGQLRNRFRQDSANPEALDVLLSSEVGCEGLDYEFCDRMVNYDIPWNPMRLEQRIGRIDRFGQASDKVLIFNFVTPGTVEERIFFRCFERLGIFRDTIGDCEEVLGEQSVTEQLLELARDPKLTPEQAELKARQLADNALRIVEEQRRLEQEGGKLLGLDQALTDEANAAQAEGRYIRPGELLSMVRYFLTISGNNGSLEEDPRNPAHLRLRLNRETRNALASRLRAWQPPDRSLLAFRRWLESGDAHLTVTFLQAAALEDRTMPFITPVHPLARLATDALKDAALHVALNLRLKTNEIPPGKYLFICDLWETIAITPGIRMMSFAWNLEAQRDEPAVAGKLLTLVARAEDHPAGPHERTVMGSAFESLEKLVQAAHRLALNELSGRNTQLVEHKLASLDAYHRNRIARIQSDLGQVQEERIRRMKSSELSRAQSEHDTRRREIESRKQSDIIRQRIAVGLLEVNHE
jgi:hypothetical protein